VALAVAVLCKAPAVALPAVARRCPPGAAQYDSNTCFWADSSRDYTWAQAAEACLGRGMRITSIHSQAENDFIFDMVTDLPWIGLSDEDHIDTFKWSDGTALDYVHWADGQPNQGNEDCVRLGDNHGLWYDTSCMWLYGVVCRGPPDYVLD